MIESADTGRRRKIEGLFDVAFDLGTHERIAFLDRECGQDWALRQEVEELLEAAGQSTHRGLHRQLEAAGLESGQDNDTVVARPLAIARPTPPPIPQAAPRPKKQPGLPQKGTLIGQYEIIRELGRGGMGAVFLARDLKLGRRVAIKVLHKNIAELTERFILEARATARCSHENIVVIHDVNDFSGYPYMVLEYLKGKTLSDVIKQGNVPPYRAIELVVPVVRALQSAHKLGLVHRDLKPDNIFLTESGTIKVLDFGIAKFLSMLPAHLIDESVTTAGNTFIHPGEFTQRGTVVGTLSYMSPEQWNAAVIDHRADIWAIGIILFKMLTGKHPLAPLRGMQLRITALLDQPMPSARDAGVGMPDEIAGIIDRCLQKHPEQRYASADDLLEALEPFLPGRYGRQLETGENPYAGLTPFQESDANRFFGRSREIARLLGQLHDNPLVGVIGPSGIGKSSLVRAGIIPALKSSGAAWEALVVRPGRYPLAALANIVAPMLWDDSDSLSERIAEHQTAVNRLYTEPGYLGTVLRTRARKHNRKIVLFVDQFEELYTLNPDQRERMAFTACLSAMADDAVSPLRVILSV